MATFRSRLVLLAVVSLSFLVSLTAPVMAQEATPAADGITILPPDESYAGATRGEWDARWWQWAVSMPEENNPNFDPTGERCGYGQSGPVFLLPTSFTFEPFTITCVVPEGMAIFVSGGGTGCSTVEPPPFFGRNEQELRACTTANMDAIMEVQASVNGQEIPNFQAYRSSSPLFTLTFPEDNFYGVPAGVALSISEGYNFIITPPPPGEYEITVSALFEGEPEPFAATIRVIVEAPQIIEPQATPEGGTPVATPAA